MAKLRAQIPQERPGSHQAPSSLSKEESLNLWEIFPDYTLSPDMRGGEKLRNQLIDSYAYTAIRLRSIFLTQALLLTKARTKTTENGPLIRIDEDLFDKAGGAFGAHLRNSSLSDLRIYYGNEQNHDIRSKLRTLFKPQDRFSRKAWESMQLALTTVWGWASHWRLEHYSYIHLAFLALIEGHQVALHDPIPVPPDFKSNIYPPLSPPFRFPTLLEPAPGWGMHQAIQAFDHLALIALDEAIPKFIDGLPPYRGTIEYSDVTSSDSRRKYRDRCKREANRVIETSLLKCLGPTLRNHIIEEVGKLAQKHSEKIDREYNRRNETAPGRYWAKYGNPLKWTAQRVVMRDEWPDIAGRNHKEQDKIEKSVKKMLPLLFLPDGAAFFEKQGRKRNRELRRK